MQNSGYAHTHTHIFISTQTQHDTDRQTDDTSTHWCFLESKAVEQCDLYLGKGSHASPFGFLKQGFTVAPAGLELMAVLLLSSLSFWHHRPEPLPWL